MGKTYEDLIRAIEDLKMDNVAEELAFLTSRMGDVNKQHTADYQRARQNDDFISLDDEKSYAKDIRK